MAQWTDLIREIGHREEIPRGSQAKFISSVDNTEN